MRTKQNKEPKVKKLCLSVLKKDGFGPSVPASLIHWCQYSLNTCIKIKYGLAIACIIAKESRHSSSQGMYPGKFWTKSVTMLVFQSPIGYMLCSFTFLY